MLGFASLCYGTSPGRHYSGTALPSPGPTQLSS